MTEEDIYYQGVAGPLMRSKNSKNPVVEIRTAVERLRGAHSEEWADREAEIDEDFSEKVEEIQEEIWDELTAAADIEAALEIFQKYQQKIEILHMERADRIRRELWTIIVGNGHK